MMAGSRRAPLLALLPGLLAAALVGGRDTRAHDQPRATTAPEAPLASPSAFPSPSASPAARRRAKALHDQAQLDYRQGRLEAAIEKFSRAHQLAGDPILLYNIAQAHRRRGDRRQAAAHYRRFVEEARGAPAHAGIEVALVERRIAELERELTQAAASGTSSGTGVIPPLASPPGTPAEVVATAPAVPPAPGSPPVSGGPLVLSAQMGLARIQVADREARPWDQPTVPVLRLGVARGLRALGGRFALGLGGQGAAVPYWDQTTSRRRRSLLLGLAATAAVRARPERRLELAVELGLGGWLWTRLGPGNPLTGKSESALLLPSAELGLPVSIDLGRGLSLRIRPGYGLALGSGTALAPVARVVHQLQLLVGTGYAFL